jgi:hypothetical protein
MYIEVCVPNGKGEFILGLVLSHERWRRSVRLSDVLLRSCTRADKVCVQDSMICSSSDTTSQAVAATYGQTRDATMGRGPLLSPVPSTRRRGTFMRSLVSIGLPSARADAPVHRVARLPSAICPLSLGGTVHAPAT